MRPKHIFLVILFGMLALIFTACNAVETASGDPLDGTSWVLQYYRKTKAITEPPITATFEGGEVHGSAGCNSYRGSYQVDGDNITFGPPIAITVMACMEPEGIMEQEALFMEYLSDAQTFKFVDDQLQIFQSDNEALTFIPQ